jgi:hypothetical protein
LEAVRPLFFFGVLRNGRSIQTRPVYGLTGNVEGSYNGGVSLSTGTDGILLEELPQLAINYANDGARAGAGRIVRLSAEGRPSGRTAGFSAKVGFKGPFAAYSASVFSNIHNGCSAWPASTRQEPSASAPRSTRTRRHPSGSSYASGGFDLYTRGEKHSTQGAFADLTLTINGPQVPVWEFAIQALMPTLPTDVAVPSITYPFAAIDAPKAVGILFTLGNLTAGVIRKLTLKLGRQINPRLDVNAGLAHQGFAPGRWTPTLEVEYEAPALVGSPFTGASTIDPYQLYDTATQFACSFQIGTAQYARVDFQRA